jgi:excisionase family DNA binding protein
MSPNPYSLPAKPLFYTVAEAVALLRIGRGTFYRHVKAGRVHLSVVAGRRTVVHRDELARLIVDDTPRPPPRGRPRKQSLS